MFVFFWFALSLVAGIVASAKNRNGFGYFLLSLVVSPFIGILLAACMPKAEPSSSLSLESQRELGTAIDWSKMRSTPKA